MRIRELFLAIIAVALFASCSWAQSGSHSYSGYSNYANSRSRLNSLTNSPTVSPYLNLIEDNTTNIDSFSGRYQTFVRPQIETRQSLARTQQSIRGLQNQLNQIQLNTALPADARPLGFQVQGYNVTGHPSYFRTYSHYYPMR